MVVLLPQVGIHGSRPGQVASSHVCVQHARSAVILREPLRRAQSHIAHIINALVQTWVPCPCWLAAACILQRGACLRLPRTCISQQR